MDQIVTSFFNTTSKWNILLISFMIMNYDLSLELLHCLCRPDALALRYGILSDILSVFSEVQITDIT